MRQVVTVLGVLLLIGGALFASVYYTPSAIAARESKAALARSIQVADNMDYMMDPGLRDADRRAGRAERNGY